MSTIVYGPISTATESTLRELQTDLFHYLGDLNARRRRASMADAAEIAAVSDWIRSIMGDIADTIDTEDQDEDDDQDDELPDNDTDRHDSPIWERTVFIIDGNDIH